jgi:1-acyl-sn-glycerol-3-phosphate acyltransferase
MAQKKKKYVKFRHKLVYLILRPMFRIFLKLRYHFTAVKYKPTVKGPHLILGNHAINMDPFMLACSFDRPIYFVATEQLFGIPIASNIIEYLVAPIAKSKSRSDLGTTKQILSIVKEGGWIGIYPEGNATNTGETVHMPKSIVKLIKLLKIPVIIHHAYGLYLSNPRWGDKLRHGKSYGRVNDVWNYEEYKDLSDEEMYDSLYQKLYINAYDEQVKNPIQFKCKQPAHFIERAVFICPKCRAIDQIYSVDDHIFCKSCSLEVQMDQYGFFNDAIEGIKTVIDWDNWQKPVAASILKAYPNDEILYTPSTEDVREMIKSNKARFKKRYGDALFYMTKDGITLQFKEETWYFKIEEIADIAMQDKNQLLIYTLDGRTIILRGEKRRSAYKYLIGFQIAKSLKTGEPYPYLGL